MSSVWSWNVLSKLCARAVDCLLGMLSRHAVQYARDFRLFAIWFVTVMQDFVVDTKCILQLWQQRKLTHSQAIQHLHASRGSHSRSLVEHVRYHEQEEKKEQWAIQRAQLGQLLQRTMRPFIYHDVVAKWQEQYRPEFYGTIKRFETLLLRGSSRLGKTSYAESLFGDAATLTVQCQGLGDDLPSLREFDRDVHRCIVFDEISYGQVVNNKALFQAGKNIVELSQSKCGGFRYSVWPYQVAMICCSNEFPVSTDEGVSSEAEADWLRHNVVVVELTGDQTWFVPGGNKVAALAAAAAGG